MANYLGLSPIEISTNIIIVQTQLVSKYCPKCNTKTAGMNSKDQRMRTEEK